MEYIRRYYGVPAKRGGRVRIWTDEEGVIVGSQQGSLRIRLDGEDRIGIYHPAYGIAYLDAGVRT